MSLSLPIFILTALVGGAIGGVVMEWVLWAVGKLGWAKADMIVALGSLFTKQRQTGWRTGVVIHAFAGFFFGILYTWAMVQTGMTHFPVSLGLGAGIGFVHGLFVSLGLVWVVADQHPLEEFKEADLAIGLSHIVGHVAYGLALGIVVAASPL